MDTAPLPAGSLVELMAVFRADTPVPDALAATAAAIAASSENSEAASRPVNTLLPEATEPALAVVAGASEDGMGDSEDAAPSWPCESTVGTVYARQEGSS